MSGREHWQSVYGRKPSDEVSWYRPHLDLSLDYIRSAGLARDARIVDVGGGASTLVDDLLSEGYRNLAVIDLADAALEATRNRLGERASDVDWVVGDVTTPLLRCVKPEGRVLVATFGLDGPETCSGLPVARYDAAGIHSVFGDVFEKLDETAEYHETPQGKTQSFVYCFCRRAG